MALLTRTNSQTDELEILVNDQWMLFSDYREKQIDEAYDKSIVFLRNRLNDDDLSKEQINQQGTKHG